MKLAWQVRRLARRFGKARAFCVVLLFTLAALRIADIPALEELRLRSFDTYQMIEPRRKTAKPVTIVDIDEKSIRKYGQFPWPRTLLADVVSKLGQMGAIVIAFDVVFPEPDRLNPDLLVNSLAGLDDETRTRLIALPSNDQVFANAIRQSRVVLGESGLPYVVRELDRTLPVTGLATIGSEPQPFMLNFPGLLRNIETIEKAAAGRGIFSIRNERDGIVRRVPMLIRTQGIVMPSLSFEMLRVASGTDTILVKSDRAGIKSIGIRGLEIPTDRNGQLWVHFARHDPSTYVSAADILDATAPPQAIAQKLVLIGTSAVGLLDVKTTPLDASMPGVEIHAQVLESALTKAVLSQPNYAIGAELLTAATLGIVVIWLAPILGPITLVIMGSIFAALLIGTSWYFFAAQRLLIDFTYPLLSTTLIYLALIFSNFIREQVQRRRIRSAFSQYLSPALVAQLAQSPDKLRLGGEEREMTIMFSDVRGFTTISESYKHDPHGLTTLMNRFLTPLTNAIIDRRGTIDKYMGDAIMAFWNAPLDDAEHQINACHAALDMLEKVDALNKQREDEAAHGGHAYIPLNVGIGLNTGICVVGNMGSDLRFDYSVLGDSVNLASRLEGQSKEYGFPIIVGSKTALAARDKFAILELDFIMVKGKAEPEVVYALAGREDTARTERFRQLQNLTKEMLTCYRNRDWDGALLAIARGRKSDVSHQLETLYGLYDKRIRTCRDNPPPANWNGAFAVLTK
ncbi:adenylate/guanylate cyclase domain-containing protein [Rhodopseudomonas boonkerdii]|uniref:CHASE2 domain-containing protein n=1 Tax=Rhodopseudomonas boonkerdii TaxID=475937 RepID=UPI001E3445CE|nr:adenylate/guanylate cyclase domain-containing protein [Rhodopseudomonas boonkerdii]UGV28587.1 adenylate/guanylate cyclase domain-containing protein [Rhodopseudomonas boonkerdii]